jgi:4-hydroxy-2-oxoheptanedioate aldolase
LKLNVDIVRGETMKKNLMKEKLSQGGVALGVLLQEPTIQATEILSLLGFDWILIDCEHSPMSIESVAQMIIAAELRRVTPLVRVPQNVPEIILRYMDVGAMGVMIPNVFSKVDVQKAVEATKYPPQGKRGLAPVRSADFGLTAPLGEYVKTSNLETMVLGLVESQEALLHVEEILETEGLDAIFIGTTDLSKSLGVPGQTNHPLILEAMEKVLAAGEKIGKPVGTAVGQGKSPKQYIGKGYRIVSTTLNSLIIEAGKQFMENARV